MNISASEVKTPTASMTFEASKPFKSRPRFSFYLVTFIFFGLLVEGVSFLTGVYLQSKNVFYKPPRIRYEEYLRLKKEMDPELGWPTRARLADSTRYDQSGSRIIPSFPDPNVTPSCLSLYGDSFTESVGTDNEHAWSNTLSRSLSCRVANYGVAAYGTDQAFLRYQKNSADLAHIVVLNHFVDDIQRNLSQQFGTIVNFKPRFILNERKDDLILIPPVTLDDKQEFQSFLVYPKKFLKYDLLAPDAKYGSRLLRFPFSVSIAQLFFQIDFLKKLNFFRIRGDHYRKFYHIEESLLLTTMICEKFSLLARERGQIPIVTIIPHVYDFIYFRKNGSWGYEPLIQNLKTRGILVLNFGEGLLSRCGETDCEQIYDRNLEARHFNQEGDRLLAEIFKEFLEQHQIGFKSGDKAIVSAHL